MRNERARRRARWQLRVASPIPGLKKNVQTLKKKRKPSPKRFAHLYGTTWWKRTRLHLLNRSPLCAHCKAAPATDVDHIKPHRGDEALFYDPDNLACLCDPCHRIKTAWERQRRLTREYRRGGRRGV